MKIFLAPGPKTRDKLGCGVDVVIYQMHRFLPQAGVTLVSSADEADIVASHISSQEGRHPDVLHCHGLYPTAYDKAEKWQGKINDTVVAAARTALQVTVPSQWVADLFRRDMGFSPAVIPHALDIEEWPKRVATPKTHTILWNKNRNTDVCDPAPVNALAKLAPALSFISTFGEAAENVKVTGAMPFEQMQQLLYETTIYLATTKETFGIGLLEAMAVGSPVVAWNWGSAPDLVQHKVTGYLAAPYDYEDTKVGIEYIKEHWEEMSGNARRYAEAFSWKAVCERYVSVYAATLQMKEEEALGRVTFVIPCYNYARFVGEAIQSVKAQTKPEFECFVVDDASTDGSAAVIQKEIEGDSRFTLIQNAENKGVAATRNLGAMRARNPFLTFLDADDRLRPTFIEHLMPTLRKNRDLGLVYGKLALMTDKGEVPNDTPSGWPGEYSPSAQLSRHNQVPSCCMMRTRIFFRTGGYRQHTAPTEDAELWSRFPLIGYSGALATPKVTYDYRMHSESASSAVRGSGKGEPDWLAWIPAASKGHVPFASVTPVNEISAAVMDYDEPLLSFVIPVGPKHKELVRDAIESVAGQIDPRWELIVVDDTIEGDLPSYGALPYAAAYPWIKWTRSEKRGNVSAARNKGVSLSRGRFLCFLDADDFLYREFSQAVLDTLLHCESDGRIVYTDWVSLPNGEVHRAENWNLDQLKQFALFAVTFAHPRKAFDAIGGFDESMILWEDWDYVVRLALAGYSGIRLTRPLFAYRYDTGDRRNESLQNKDRLLRAMRAKYELAIPTRRKT